MKFENETDGKETFWLICNWVNEYRVSKFKLLRIYVLFLFQKETFN